VARLDVIDWPIIDPRQSGCPLATEIGLPLIDWELDGTRAAWLGVGTVKDELPGDMVEHAPIVVDRVAKTGGVGLRETRHSPVHDDPKGEGRSDWERVSLEVSFQTNGGLGFTLIEPTSFAICDVGMEVRPLQLDFRALEGIR